MAGAATESEEMQPIIASSHHSDEHRISIEEPLQTSTSQDAASHSSDGNSTEEDWLRSMSTLPESHHGQQKKSVQSPARTVPETTHRDSDKEWYQTIIEAGRKTASQPQREKFAKVPHMLRRKEANSQNFYNPSVVCIGPYHYGDKNLRREEIKAKMAYKFVLQGNEVGGSDETEKIDKMFKKVEKVSEDVKKYYNIEGSTSKIISDDKEFARMMFLDACFILQFIHWSISDYRSLVSVMNDHFARAVRQDLLLLENQLPLQVLTCLMDNKPEWENRFRRYFVQYVFRFHSPKVSFWRFLVEVCSVLGKFSCITVYRAFKAQSQDAPQREAFEDNPQHLLAFFHARLINEKRIGETPTKRHLKYSAKELKRVGVKFEASWTCFLTDIKFGKRMVLAGRLKLPQLTIDETTKSLLLNFVAYEYCHEPAEKRWVTSYICFMDSLINDVEDVEVLRKGGILYNFRETDQAVADLFNNMGTYLIPNFSAYDDAKKSINAHCKKTVKKWAAEFWHVYFRSPWSIIAFLAGTLVIFLTAVQTYFTAFPKN